MTVLVSAETVLLVLLLILVAGLLRSHAELLRRLGPDGSGIPDPRPAVRGRPGADGVRGDTAAPVISGATLMGDPVVLDPAGAGAEPMLLAFLTSGCSTCREFWHVLGHDELPGVQTVILAKGSDRERPSRLRELAPAGVPVVVSSAAWDDYQVPGSPYFVLVHGAVRGEGAAGTWTALRSLVSDALDDTSAAAGPDRARRVDEVLATAGIHPGDPSLYPAEPPEGSDP